MNGKIEIPLSKKKTILLIFGSVFFVYFGFKIFIEPEDFATSSRFVNFIKHILSTVKIDIKAFDISRGFGAFTLLLFGATTLFGIKKLFDKKPGLIIDSNGITDNTGALSIGFIEWNDIAEVGKKVVSSQSFIVIHIKNPEEYIKNTKNIIQKLYFKLNLKLYQTPFFITTNTLKYNF
jgi:hypothetical protein